MPLRSSNLSSPSQYSGGDLSVVLATAALGLLQLLWLVRAEAAGPNRLIGLLLAVTGVWLVVRPASRQATRPIVVVLAVALACNLVAAGLGLAPKVPVRLPMLLVTSACLTIALGTILGLQRERGLGLPLVIAGLLVAPFFVAELAVSTGPLPLAAEPSPVFGKPPLPDAGAGYSPLSQAHGRYPDDLGGYLDVAGAESPPWELAVLDSVTARLSRLAGDSLLRVDIDSASERVAWKVQLRQFPVRLRQGQSYQLSFRARAESRRNLLAMVTLGRPPWSWLGFGQTISLDTLWQGFRFPFVATESDSAAWLRFDLGESHAAVEFRDVQLYGSASTGGDTSGVAFTLPYHFDSLGCRGENRPILLTDGVRRILALGDSYTLGAGVRDNDAWPARLEALLNRSGSATPGTRPVQVFNCAVTGAGTADARERFESLANAVRPDLVLLGLVVGDDRRRSDDVAVPFLTMRPIDHVFRTVHWWRHRIAEREFVESSLAQLPVVQREVARLDSVVRAAGSRLAVLVLQDQASRAWHALAGAVADSAGPNARLPVLSLGERIRVFHEDDRYVQRPFDLHPSRTIHRTIAEAAESFMRQRRLLEPVDSVARNRQP